MFAKLELELNVNNILIPSFEIDKGEIKYFELNCVKNKNKKNDLLSALSLESKIPGLMVLTKIAISKSYSKKLIKTKISDIPNIERLIKESEEEYKIIFQQYFNKKIIFLPGNFRTLIALHIACSKSKFVAFDTAGMDPLGEQMLLRYVEKKRKEGWGFLYFKFTITQLIAHEKNIFNSSWKDWILSIKSKFSRYKTEFCSVIIDISK